LVGKELSDQKEFRGGDKETPYNVMFGPDICGSSTRKVHFILSKNGKNHLIKKNIQAETDEYTHIYTAVLNADNTYQVFVDGEEKAAGSVEEDWDILPPKKIRDPSVSKPGDWVDEKHIDDPEDVKPEGWDDIPSEIADPDAKKPEDWDDELDGEWESPRVSNPEYKGLWSAKKIENPAYKGEWVHPEIDNPDYSEDKSLYAFESFNYLGIDIWQVKSGSVFDNFLLADDLEDAKAAWKVVETRREGEKSVTDERDKEEREKKRR
jgi:calreticulin